MLLQATPVQRLLLPSTVRRLLRLLLRGVAELLLLLCALRVRRRLLRRIAPIQRLSRLVLRGVAVHRSAITWLLRAVTVRGWFVVLMRAPPMRRRLLVLSRDLSVRGMLVVLLCVPRIRLLLSVLLRVYPVRRLMVVRSLLCSLRLRSAVLCLAPRAVRCAHIALAVPPQLVRQRVRAW